MCVQHRALVSSRSKLGPVEGGESELPQGRVFVCRRAPGGQDRNAQGLDFVPQPGVGRHARVKPASGRRNGRLIAPTNRPADLRRPMAGQRATQAHRELACAAYRSIAIMML